MQRKIFALVFIVALLAQFSLAIGQNRTWVANSSGNWSDSARWSPNDVPDETTENAVFSFNSTTAAVATVDQNFSIGDLTLNFNNTLNILADNTLTVNNFTNNSLGTITGEGHLVVGGSGTHNWETLIMQGTGSTTFSAGILNVIRLNNPAQVTSRTINTDATTNWTDSQSALTLSNATWNNGGAFTRNQTVGASRNLDLTNNSIFNNLSEGIFVQIGTVASTVTGGTFNNAGTVRSAAASLTFSGAVTNSGTMQTLGGALNLNGPTTNSGNIRAENGNVTIAGNFINNGGDLVAVGSNTININGTYTHNGGKFIVDGGNIGGSAALAINTAGANLGGIEGVGTLTQSVTMNAGTYIAPGNSPGVLTFNNDLTMNGGELRIEIGGLSQGVDFDFINVLGDANMTNVTVVASLFGAFEPTFVGQQFEFFRAANALDGTQWTLAANDTFTLNVTGNSAFLVSAVPEPSSLILLGLCTGLGLFARKRRLSAPQF